MHTIETTPCRWLQMALDLQGEPLPPPPAMPGRQIVAEQAGTVEADAAELVSAAVWASLAADHEGADRD